MLRCKGMRVSYQSLSGRGSGRGVSEPKFCKRTKGKMLNGGRTPQRDSGARSRSRRAQSRDLELVQEVEPAGRPDSRGRSRGRAERTTATGFSRALGYRVQLPSKKVDSVFPVVSPE